MDRTDFRSDRRSMIGEVIRQDFNHISFIGSVKQDNAYYSLMPRLNIGRN